MVLQGRSPLSPHGSAAESESARKDGRGFVSEQRTYESERDIGSVGRCTHLGQIAQVGRLRRCASQVALAGDMLGGRPTPMRLAASQAKVLGLLAQQANSFNGNYEIYRDQIFLSS